MLPSFAELGKITPADSGADADAFDEATYGIWTTIMETLKDDPTTETSTDIPEAGENPLDAGDDAMDPSLHVVWKDKAPMSEARQKRLEEFCDAFLGMSVFGLADVAYKQDLAYRYPSTITV